ncbi:hypothetical protein CMI47_21995 [Candidatus Pacearchaeota archaeon]|nr:hypothetical protein [Candidatus Pacearchaeota archaeon]|tara:strand:- start:3689 stop:4378 length:690 start_codon:yes stop_codon:yes gene_type:complete
MNGLISFSLYGDDPRYTENCIKNKPLADRYYPDWTLRFYHDNTVPAHTLSILEDQGCELIDMTENDIHGVVWRCLAVDDENYDAVIIRDADSRVNYREAQAVKEWLNNEETLHSMRDAKEHNMLFQTGMWGCKPKQKKFSMTEWLNISEPLKKKNYQHISGYTWDDQLFLGMLLGNKETHINDVLAHDDWLRHTDKQRTLPFPTNPRPRQHVGYAFLDPTEESERDSSE